MIKIHADQERCQGYANCVVAASDVFDLDDAGIVIVLRDEIENSEREHVDESARSCPLAAHRLKQMSAADH
ncbi:ferredoxin [Mycolicibacterium rutilum]|uniref:ferredoxin n=1 Tax=Mycolicibacterium rutilum TaxID=370526 RepID=UPI0009F5093E|nr:ferredoxin [Mycolicibacterium rutilum]